MRRWLDLSPDGRVAQARVTASSAAPSLLALGQKLFAIFRSIRVIAALVALLCASSGASEPERIGFGIRSSGLAGTGAATADDYEATYANPAGLAWARHRRLTLGYVMGEFDLALDGASRSMEGTYGILLGADLPLPLGGPLQDRLALGLGFYLPTGVINRARAPLPDKPWLPLLDSTTQTVSVMVSGALRLTDRLGIGGGVLALAALEGVIRLQADAAGHTTSQSEQQLITDFSPILGARLDLTSALHLGATFRGASQSRYHTVIEGKLGNSVPFALPAFSIQGTSQYDPLQALLESAYQRGHWLFAAQLTYKHWSAYVHPNQPATAGATPPPPPEFHDTVVPRAALEWQHDGKRVHWRARGGYFFEWSPTPDAGPTRTLIDASQHVIALGGELNVESRHAPFRVELFFQWHQLQPNERVRGGFGVGGLSASVELK